MRGPLAAGTLYPEEALMVDSQALWAASRAEPGTHWISRGTSPALSRKWDLPPWPRARPYRLAEVSDAPNLEGA